MSPARDRLASPLPRKPSPPRPLPAALSSVASSDATPSSPPPQPHALETLSERREGLRRILERPPPDRRTLAIAFLARAPFSGARARVLRWETGADTRRARLPVSAFLRARRLAREAC